MVNRIKKEVEDGKPLEVAYGRKVKVRITVPQEDGPDEVLEVEGYALLASILVDNPEETDNPRGQLLTHGAGGEVSFALVHAVRSVLESMANGTPPYDCDCENCKRANLAAQALVMRMVGRPEVMAHLLKMGLEEGS